MSQPTNGQLPLLGVLRRPELIPAEAVAAFGDDEDAAVRSAILWAWHHRRVKGMTQRVAALSCELKPQHFANILAGRKYLPLQRLNQFEAVMGNTAVSQTIERFRRLRDERLQRELAELVAEQMRRSA